MRPGTLLSGHRAPQRTTLQLRRDGNCLRGFFGATMARAASPSGRRQRLDPASLPGGFGRRPGYDRRPRRGSANVVRSCAHCGNKPPRLADRISAAGCSRSDPFATLTAPRSLLSSSRKSTGSQMVFPASRSDGGPLPPPTGERDDNDVVAAFLADRLRRGQYLKEVYRQDDVRAKRLLFGDGGQPCAPGPRRGRCSRKSAMLSAASTLSSTTRIRSGAPLVRSGASNESGVASPVSSLGSRTMNSLPHPSPWLCASISPPWSSTSRYARVSPIPSPPSMRSLVRSTCVNMSKTRVSMSFGIPMPSSLTRRSQFRFPPMPTPGCDRCIR